MRKKIMSLLVVLFITTAQLIAQIDTVFRLIDDTIEYKLEYNVTEQTLYKGTLYIDGTISSLKKRVLTDWERSEIKEKQLEQSWINKEMPKLGFKDIDGNTINAKTLKDKVVLIDFWFVQCGSCVAQMPKLNELKKEYEGKNILFLSMTYETEKSIRKFLKKHEFNYTHIPNVKKYIDNFGEIYPKSLIIDKKGMIRYIDGSLAVYDSYEEKDGVITDKYKVPEESLNELREKLNHLLNE